MSELQVSLESGDGLTRRIRVRVPAARVESAVETRLQVVGRSAKIKGFRPGKVPQRVIRQRYGGQVREEVLEQLLKESYSEAISRERLRPAGGPTIEPEQLEAGEDLAYVATFEVYPEIQLTGLDAIEVSRPEVDISDADVDAMVENLRGQRATWAPVEAPAAEGHRVRVDFDGRLGDEPLPGGHGEDVAIHLGEGQMLADFEQAVLGLAAGDQKTFDLRFPDDYHEASLAGRTATFDVTLREVAERVLPAVDAELARGFGIESGDLDEFRADVRRNMEREAGARVRAAVKRQVMDGLLAANSVDVPRVLVDEEAVAVRRDALRRMNLPEDDPRGPADADVRAAAERRVRLGLLVGSLIADQKMQVDRDRLRAKVDEMCAPYDQPEELARMYFQNPQLISQVENMVLEDQVVDWLVEHAKVSPQPVAFREFMEA